MTARRRASAPPRMTIHHVPSHALPLPVLYTVAFAAAKAFGAGLTDKHLKSDHQPERTRRLKDFEDYMKAEAIAKRIGKLAQAAKKGGAA